MSEDSFEVFEEKPDHAFRTEIPNIVEELGLDPYEYRLYAYYKKVAGDKSCCFQSRKTITKKTGISKDKQIAINEKLRRGFSILGDKSLIRIYETKKEDGSQGPCQVLIVDIWRENGDYFRRKKEEGGVVAQNDGGSRSERRGSRSERHKEDPFKNNHNNNNNRAAPSPSASPPPAECVVVFSCLNELSLKDHQKRALTTSMEESKAITLVKRVKRWEGRSSDYLAIQTILSRWDEWEDSQTQDEKEEALSKQEEILEEKASNRKERASQILIGLEIAPFKIKEDVIEIKTKRGFHPISWRDEEVDTYLDSIKGD